MRPGEESFQSQFGFSALCDSTTTPCYCHPPTFQSQFGFSALCDPPGQPQRAGNQDVSIPVRVFCPLRQVETTLSWSGSAEFQSQFGFSALCDLTIATGLTVKTNVSIPVRVFCPLRRRPRRSRPRYAFGCFNPSSGFLPSATMFGGADEESNT